MEDNGGYVARWAGESGHGKHWRTLGRKRHPRAATEPEIDTAGGKRLLQLGVARELRALDFDTLFGEEALLNADIEGQESPGTAL